MGPLAWAAVARALGYALVMSFFGGQNSIVTVVAREIQRAIISKNLDFAEQLLRDMAFRHHDSFIKFVSKYRNDLPEELFSEFSEYL